MHSFRLFSAACILLCLVTGALLPPLHALLLSYEALAARRAATPPDKHAGDALAPAGVVAALPAGRRFETRWHPTGQVRRVYFPSAEDRLGTPSERALQLLHGQMPRLSSASELQVVSERRSPSGVHVRVQQHLHDVPVWGGEAVVSFDRRGTPILVANDVHAAIPAKASSADAAQPQVSATAALQQARQHIGVRSQPYATPAVELHWRIDADRWRLAWRVTLACAEPAGDWQVWLDAADGRLIERRDRTLHVHPAGARAGGVTAIGRVFLPDPVTASGNTALQDNDDAASAVPPSAYRSVTLRDLDPPKQGILALHGPYVHIVDWESPNVAPVTATGTFFEFDRDHSGFEDVMAYYHIDTMQRWYQSLGFEDVNNRSQPVDTHGFWGEDNSKYVPSLGWLSFGEGGVDDAEDAGVIVHEYGHATQYDVVSTWGIGGHTPAMGEGFGDYLANSYAWSMYPERVVDWNGVFQWDGHNEFWSGRPVINPSLHYPENANGSPHASGTLWCSALTDALYLLQDRAVMDRLVLNHHFMLTGHATMEDAANAILVSDVALHEGAHVAALTEVFARWGMLDDASTRPVLLLHDPPEMQASTQALPQVTAQFVAIDPQRDPQHVWLHVRDESGTASRWPMQPQGDGVWAAALPGSNSEDVFLHYWFESIDAQGDALLLPAAGEAEAFTFLMGRIVEDFELDGAWQAGITGDDATRGHWLRGAPVGTAWQPAEDHSGTGTQCWVTGNAAIGSPSSDADVDGGTTTLRSPLWDVTDSATLHLSYWRWFATNAPSSGDDRWRVRARTTASGPWEVLEELTAGELAWRAAHFDLGARFPGATQLQLEFAVTDGGGGSLVEAALDDLVLRTRSATGVSTVPAMQTRLHAHPNPFNPQTTVSFEMPHAGRVRIQAYDIHGRRVGTLLDEQRQAGVHRLVWDGRDLQGRALGSGVYLLQLRTDRHTETRKVTLLR